MDIDAAVTRHIQDCRRQNLPESSHNGDFEVVFFQFFYSFRLPNLLRLEDRHVMLYRPGLHLGNRDLPASPVHPVRLGHNKDNLVSSATRSKTDAAKSGVPMKQTFI